MLHSSWWRMYPSKCVSTHTPPYNHITYDFANTKMQLSQFLSDWCKQGINGKVLKCKSQIWMEMEVLMKNSHRRRPSWHWWCSLVMHHVSWTLNFVFLALSFILYFFSLLLFHMEISNHVWRKDMKNWLHIRIFVIILDKWLSMCNSYVKGTKHTVMQ